MVGKSQKESSKDEALKKASELHPHPSVGAPFAASRVCDERPDPECRGALDPAPGAGAVVCSEGPQKTLDTADAVIDALRLLVASHVAQLDREVGAGLVPAPRRGTREGCPHPSWFGGNRHGGDRKPSHQCERPCGHRDPRERDLYPPRSAARQRRVWRASNSVVWEQKASSLRSRVQESGAPE